MRHSWFSQSYWLHMIHYLQVFAHREISWFKLRLIILSATEFSLISIYCRSLKWYNRVLLALHISMSWFISFLWAGMLFKAFLPNCLNLGVYQKHICLLVEVWGIFYHVIIYLLIFNNSSVPLLNTFKRIIIFHQCYYLLIKIQYAKWSLLLTY